MRLLQYILIIKVAVRFNTPFIVNMAVATEP